mgnify:CR=1 FL=1
MRRVKLDKNLLSKGYAPLAAISKDEARVIELLKREEMDADEICRKLNQPISAVSILLSNLGLKGVIEESGGKFMLGFR